MKAQSSSLFNAYLLTPLLACLPLSLHASAKEAPYSWQTFGYEQLLCPELFSDILKEQDTLQGCTRSTGGITVENYKNVICSNKIQRSNGGIFNAVSVTIQNIQNDIKLIANISEHRGGAIYTAGDCCITQNLGKQYYVRNQADASSQTSETNYGGAIYCEGNLELSKNRGTLCFAYNTARIRGGAISSSATLKISGNSAPILLMNNFAFHLAYQGYGNENGKGGAIYCRDCEIVNNSGPICITSNCAPVGGGCYATSTVAIKNNSDLIFFSNNSGVAERPITEISGGGAISAPTINIENNSGPICFNSNVSNRDGGALWCTTLTLKNNRPVQFTNNRTKWGGALLIKNNGSCDLSADNGDVIFDNNCGITDSNQLYRNAIHCTAGATLKVGAKQNYSVKFYDPIEFLHQAQLITFNHEDYHQGTILLSGALVPDSFQGEKNFTSDIKNPLTIKYGVLAIEDRAGLAAYQITQEKSTLRLGNGAVVRTNVKSGTTSNDSALNITSLTLNLPSLVQKGAQAPKIWIYPTSTTTNNVTTYAEDPNPTITLSGPLKLVNSDNEDPYDSLNLSSKITGVPFLYLCDNAAKKITITDLDIQAINQNKHYGYQGTWTPYWKEEKTTPDATSALTANSSHRLLYADWTPTGYIPNPKYCGDLVANALWQAAYNAITGLHNLPLFLTNERFIGVAGGGSGAYVSQKTRNAKPGFELFSKGYATQASRSTETNRSFALSFSQFYSEIKESESKDKVSANCYFAGAQLQIPWFYENLLTSASLGYAYSQNHVKTKNQTTNALSEGDFHSHTLGSELRCMFRERAILNLQFRPFIKTLWVRSTQGSFTETGKNSRNFKTKDPLINMTLPLGIYGYAEHEVYLKTSWEMQLAYTPTIYRQKPKITTTRIVSNGSWITSGTPVNRHAFSISIKNTTNLDRINLSMNYHGDFSKSTLCNFLNITSELQF